MNSMSKCHDDRDDCRKEKRECPTIIKCGCPGSTTVPVATVLGTTFPLTSVTLNTSRLKDPCVKLEFASNLIAAVAFTGTLNFQVFKQCRGQNTPVPVGPAWQFSLVALVSSQTFTFFVCDCDCSCFDECCTYTVTATVASPVTVGTLSINNATLGAIAACRSECDR